MSKKASSKRAKKIPQSFFSRTISLVGTASLIAGREIAGNIAERVSAHPEVARLKTRLKQAQDVVDGLSHLKGAAMKAGQMLSVEFSDLLPPEVVKVLRNLHDNGTFLPIKDIKKILRKELGPEAFRMVENLSDEPIAAASIGQVHSARINGRDVVLKVQYPGVGLSIDNDVSLLKKLVVSIISMQGRNISFDGVFEEIAAGLKLEVDYLLEARSLQAYRQAVSDQPQFIVPECFPEFSTAKVLTLSFEHGERLNEWLHKPKIDIDRDAFAANILDLLHLEFFVTGLVQTDPNYGNFLVRDQGRKLVLLDFGAVRQYDEPFRANVRRLLTAAINRDNAQTTAIAEKSDLLDPRESPEIKAQFCALMEMIVEVFREENQPFHFANESYLKEIRDSAIKFARSVKFTGPAKDLLFLNRKLGGMFHLLKDAGCSADVHRFWQLVEQLELREVGSVP